MAKNYMQDVARMLGVELGEEFKIDGSNSIYKFFENELCFQCGGAWLRADNILIDLIKGAWELVKLPWQPGLCDAYYYPNHTFRSVEGNLWNNSAIDFALKEAGMIFRTAEECEAALPALRKKYLGGDDNV